MSNVPAKSVHAKLTTGMLTLAASSNSLFVDALEISISKYTCAS